MQEYLVDKKLLNSEGDVETKVLVPLMTNSFPEGLGYENANIQSKLSLRKLKIKKRVKAELYYPDYLITVSGIPTVVIETKKPGEDILEGYREARLYAHEINSLYPSTNPCELVLATDGLKILAGVWDSTEPKYNVDNTNWLTSNEVFSQFIEEFNLVNLRQIADRNRGNIRPNKVYNRPSQHLGGKHIQNRQIKNSFGESISINYRHLFNPTEEAERIDVVHNAYVQIQKHESHVAPIDRLIRKKVRPSILESKEIKNNEKPTEIIDKLANAKNYNNQLLLLIGNVGSGKSTFTTYLKEIALSTELRNSLTWVRLDLNLAPLSKDEIYFWLKKSVIDSLSKDSDLSTMEMINEVYSNEITEFKNWATEILDENSTEYKVKLFDEIKKLKSDIDVTLQSCINHFVHKQNNELIIVLDNCDKRNLEEQLLMFEVANWLKDNTKSIVFLPLRETTFDHHRHQKPLDTVIKDLIFRINPPSLEKVLYSRIKYAKRLNEKSSTRQYSLPNGMRVSYPNNEQIHYLGSILTSLFQNHLFKRMMMGMAGRNVRRGIEFFLDFCKSGHIHDSDIYKMKQSEGEYKLPNHIITRVFFRGNRLFYSDADSKVRNLFYSEPKDELPDPFARIAIMQWLKKRQRKKGPSGIIGFHKLNELVNQLSANGHSELRIVEEIKNLINADLIISESQDSEDIDLEELAAINTPGVVHLELLKNIDYLASCSEDVWYNNKEISQQIAQRISGKGRLSHFSIQTSLNNCKDLIDYCENYANEYYSFNKSLLNGDNQLELIDFEEVKEVIKKFESSLNINPFIEFEPEQLVKGKVVNILDSGYICELNGSDQVGYLHVSQYNEEKDIFDVGESIDLEIIEFQPKHGKYSLKLYNGNVQ